MATRPKILLIALESKWHGAARLPQALQEAGFSVGVACRPNAYLIHTRFRDQLFVLSYKNHGPGLLAGIRTIVRAWRPDLVLPLDDRAALLLAGMHEFLSQQAGKDDMGELLKYSLGNPAAIFEAASKARTTATARRLGWRVPAGQSADSAAEVLAFGEEHGFPVVIKRSFSCSGAGVFICAGEVEAVTTMATLRPSQSLKIRLAEWREEVRGRKFRRQWFPADQSLTVNQFIAGKCATSLAAAMNGQTLAIVTAERVQSYPDDKGPCSVLWFVRNEEMRRVSTAMIRHWGLTGLVGFDFILDPAGKAWLLECNPRATPLAHLGHRAGEDLCAALYAKLAGTAPPPATPREGLMVAHYPVELWRDPHSHYLTEAFHDVPQDDPELWAAYRQEKPS